MRAEEGSVIGVVMGAVKGAVIGLFVLTCHSCSSFVVKCRPIVALAGARGMHNFSLSLPVLPSLKLPLPRSYMQPWRHACESQEFRWIELTIAGSGGDMLAYALKRIAKDKNRSVTFSNDIERGNALTSSSSVGGTLSTLRDDDRRDTGTTIDRLDTFLERTPFLALCNTLHAAKAHRMNSELYRLNSHWVGARWPW